MKKIVFIYLLLLSCFVYSQHSREKLEKSAGSADSLISFVFNSPFDSIPESRFHYFYNGEGNKTLTIEYAWNQTSSSWMSIQKQETLFNSNSQISNFTVSQWSSSQNSWISDYRLAYQYNQNNDLVETIKTVWIQNSQNWLNDSRTTLVYDATSVIENTEFWWNTQCGCWDTISQIAFEYDTAQNRIAETIYYWSDQAGGRKNYSRKLRSFNINNKVVQEENQKWDTLLIEWRPLNRTEYNYNNTGYVDSLMFYEYNSGWYTSTMAEYSYIQDSLVADELVSFWDTIQQIWVGSQQSTTTYTSNGLREDYQQFIWDDNLQTWNGTIRYKFRYNSAGENTLFSYFTWDFGTWNLYKNYHYYYGNSSIAHLPTGKSWSVYPNPAYETITVYNPERNEKFIQLTDRKGITRAFLLQPGMNLLDITYLQAGLYFLSNEESSLTLIKL